MLEIRKTKSETGVPVRREKKYTLSLSKLVVAILFLVAVSLVAYFYFQNKPSEAPVKEETEDLARELSQYVDLPADETPTLATVTDKEKLADQAFFAKAENGDKVLIYSKAGKVILYRPSTKKIVDMTTMSAATQEVASQELETAPESATVRIALLNGSSVELAAGAVENQLKPVLPNATVNTKTDAEKRDYADTIVVVLNSSAAEAAATLAQNLGGTVGVLPEGETAPADTDIVVIIGENTMNTLGN